MAPVRNAVNAICIGSASGTLLERTNKDHIVPELPEVETMVRGIRPYAEGRTLLAMKSCRCRRKPIAITPALAGLRRRIVGRRVLQVARLGKRIVLAFDNEDRLVIEPRMTGLLLVSDPPSQEHLRLQWEFSGTGEHRSVWFWDRRGLGTVRLCSGEEYAERIVRQLGRDALEMKLADWRTVCGQTSRPIKVLLMDQAKVLGIGNLYASEILHQAGVSPARAADALSADDVRCLQRAVSSVLKTAIRYEGSTLADGTYRNALNQSGRYQNEHRVYMKAGQICPRCRAGAIERIVQSQRSTFFCPVCQT